MLAARARVYATRRLTAGVHAIKDQCSSIQAGDREPLADRVKLRAASTTADDYWKGGGRNGE